jgi:hypothetical protein
MNAHLALHFWFAFVNEYGSYNFGNGVTVSPAGTINNVVLVKYNSSGVAQWAQTNPTGSSASQYNAVAIDGSGNIFAAGNIEDTGSYSFGNGVTASGTNTTNLGWNWIVVKYNSAGVAQWARSVSSGSDNSSVSALAADSAGNVYAGGFIDGGTYQFGTNVSITGANSSGNVALIKYNSSGTAQWAQTTSTGISSLTGLTLDGAGNVYAAGNISGTGSVNFGNGVSATIPTAGGSGFVIEYTPSGDAAWVDTQTSGSTGSYDAITLASGTPIVAGSLAGTGTAGFGNSITASAPGSSNNVLAVHF